MSNAVSALSVRRKSHAPRVGAFITASLVCSVVRPVPKIVFCFTRNVATRSNISVSSSRNRVSSEAPEGLEPYESETFTYGS